MINSKRNLLNYSVWKYSYENISHLYFRCCESTYKSKVSALVDICRGNKKFIRNGATIGHNMECLFTIDIPDCNNISPSQLECCTNRFRELYAFLIEPNIGTPYLSIASSFHITVNNFDTLSEVKDLLMETNRDISKCLLAQNTFLKILNRKTIASI